MKRKKLKNQNDVFVGLYITKDMAVKLADRCAVCNITISEAIRLMLRNHLEAK